MKKKVVLLDKLEVPPELTTMQEINGWYLRHMLELTRVPEDFWEKAPKVFRQLPFKDEDEEE